MTADRYKLFQLFKYTVYLLLTLNIFLFFAEEWAAAAHRFGDGIALADVIEGFAATIDTAAWVVLLLLFELETYVLDEDQVGKRTLRIMHLVRALCYAFIVYAFYGYLTKLLFLLGAEPMSGLDGLCSLVGNDWAYAVDLDEYQVITAANCSVLSAAEAVMQLPGLTAVVDSAGLTDIVRLAWVDVINSGVWLLVVLLLEIDVRLQERDLYEGFVFRVSTLLKYTFYPILLIAAIYWGVKGDFVDFWDAFLWLVAFVFIELNVFEWRRESHAELGRGDGAAPAL